MTVMLRRPAAVDSTEVAQTLELAERLAGLADRTDLLDRLGALRSRLAERPLRVVLAGGHAGSTGEVSRALRRLAPRWLPGATFADAPGGDGRGWSPPAGSADVVLFVSDAGQEYGRGELDTLSRLRSQGLPVLAVLAHFDSRSNWAEVQRADRARLQAAGLDSPSVPLLPVSAALCEYAAARHDDDSVVASGVPQLLETLRDRIGTPVDAGLRDAVRAEARVVADQVTALWTGELARRRDEARAPRPTPQEAMAELERRQQLSARWQITLGDGVTEMGAELDFALRERLRAVLEHTDQRFRDADPVEDWTAFDADVRERIAEAARDDQRMLVQRAQGLAQQVAATLTGAADGTAGGVALPLVDVREPTGAVERVRAMEPPEGGGSLTSRVVNSVRGSYGGVLMVGVPTSLLGQPLISVYSVAAGVLLGAFTFWEDRKNTRERRTGEGRTAAAKLLDEANFRLGDHQRAQVRAVHRTLRDHFTAINDARLQEAADAVRAASDPAADDTRHARRIGELESHLADARLLHDDRTSAPRHRAGTA